MSIRPKSAEAAFFAAAVFVLLLNLGVTSCGLRLATADDVAVFRGLADPARATENRMHDLRLGRFYAEVKFFLLEALMRVPNETLHAAIRVGACFAAVLAAAWFMWEWRRNERLSLLVICLGIGLLPLSVGYQALLSYPLLWLGWAGVWAMGALALRADSAWSRAGMMGAFALALVVHEANAVFVIWPALLRRAANRHTDAKFLREELVRLGVVLGGYGALFLFVRHEALAAAPWGGYAGAELSPDFRAAAFALNVFTWSGLPGLESWIGRWREASAAPWLSPEAWMHRAITGATGLGVAGALMLGAAAGMGTARNPGGGERRPARAVPGYVALLFAAFAPNLVLAVTVKYQGWSHQRMYPYYYTSMSYLAWVVLLAAAAADALDALRHAAGRRVAGASIAVGVFVLALGVNASNREAAALLRHHPFYHMSEYRRWFPPR